LLLPLFLVEWATFEEEQRVKINRSFSVLMAVTGFGNITLAKEVIDCVWHLIYADDSESWDRDS